MMPPPNDVEEAAGYVDNVDESSGLRQRGPELSKSAKRWDLDGDGQLDEDEQALKERDAGGKGYLSNIETLKLLQDQQTQIKESMAEALKSKFIIKCLAGMLLLTTLSSFGTSWATAIMAQALSGNEEGNLINKKTGEVLATQTASNVFVLKSDPEMERRRLDCQKTGQVDSIQHSLIGEDEVDCKGGNWDVNTLPGILARDIISQCRSGHSVSIEIDLQVETHQIQICGSCMEHMSNVVYYKGYSSEISNITLDAHVLLAGESLSIFPQNEQIQTNELSKEVKGVIQTSYEVDYDSTQYSISGLVLALNLPLGSHCLRTDQCAEGHRCLEDSSEGKRCFVDIFEPCDDDSQCGNGQHCPKNEGGKICVWSSPENNSDGTCRTHAECTCDCNEGFCTGWLWGTVCVLGRA